MKNLPFSPERLFFKIERYFLNLYFKKSKKRPSSYPFLSGDSYKEISTIEYTGGKLKITKPEVIFISSYLLSEFSMNINAIKYPYIIISHHGDENIDSRFNKIYEHKYLYHWYAQNNTVNHAKITPIPIGLEDAWRHNNGIVRDFKKLRNTKVKKKPKIIYGFTVKNNFSERLLALNHLSKSSSTVFFQGNSRSYRKELNKYMFVASPSGNGIDCHRTWEAIYLGVIPIVVKDSFYEQFNNLPVLTIDNWSQIDKLDEKELSNFYLKNKSLLDNTDYIWLDYWRNKINLKFLDLKNDYSC